MAGNKTYAEWLRESNIDANDWVGKPEEVGLMDSYVKSTGINSPTETGMFSGLGNLTGSQLGGYAQLGGLALGTIDDLFGTGGKAKKQQLANMKKSSVLLDQQIANNTQSMADKKAFNQGMADASRQAMGLGTVYNYDKK